MEPGQEYNEEAALRRLYITKRMVTKYNPTRGCPGCFLPGRAHTEECRQRIIISIKNDPEEMEQLRLRRPQGLKRVLAEDPSAVPAAEA
eukprot:1275914-Amphidinium_carterae.1